MNEELEVRESSLSYVIGSMNNNSTRKSEDNDPCGQGHGMIKYGIARYVMGRRRRCADTFTVVLLESIRVERQDPTAH